METILMELISGVENGQTFFINLEERTMKLGKKYLINKGEYDLSRKLTTVFDEYKDITTILKAIEHLYRTYKYSVPCQRSETKHKKYFKCLPFEDIPDECLFNPVNRYLQQARLEGFILCAIMSNALKWDEEQLGKWFYQSPNDPDLIILRTWVDGKEK